jgi:general secretion pathway protein C
MALAMVVFRGRVGRSRRTVELLLLGLAAWLAALGATTALRIAVDDVPPAVAAPDAPAVETLEPLTAYAAITEGAVFGPAAATRRGDGARPSALRLWGVAFTGDEARAVVEDTASGRQDLYRVGDTIGEARVTAISWDRVTLAGPRGEETLELAAPAPTAEPPAAEVPATAVREAAAGDRIRQTGENAFVVDRRELAGGVEGMSGLLTQLRAVAEVRDGRPAGFRLFQIRAASLFARLGLRDGDVVQRVNGTAISEPAALLGFLQRLGEEPRVALDIVRGDRPRTLVYELR